MCKVLEVSCKQKIDLVALQTEGRQLSVTVHGLQQQVFSFGNHEFKYL